MSDSESQSWNSLYRALTPEKKLGVWQKILSGRRFERVREFLVAERGPDPKARSFIIHLPTGLWRGFETAYQVTRWQLMNRPGADAELLNLLFEVK
ncbi:MAG: hypothetical protein NT105_19050 [Verrucomicrobia bacterium]|nr:hypothetical protein [Verrucomicrobiota bacterium]